MEADFRQEAIRINRELAGALKATLIQTKLLKDLASPRAYKLAGPDIERMIHKLEEEISRVEARQTELEKEE